MYGEVLHHSDSCTRLVPHNVDIAHPVKLQIKRKLLDKLVI